MSKNAVAAIRVSTTKQGTDGDSPDAQKEQIERFAQNKGYSIKKFFVFLESASKEQQPMQEAIDYCSDPSNDVDLFIIKSIDRFTRGGSLSYDLLKNQLDKSNVGLVDIYGVISSQKVNTLDHLGVEYKWSVYSPSKKSEILEAERSKDELRDIMSRMIGAEVRYTRLGYWMRQPPYGYRSEKIDTPHGKRTILKPEPKEAKYIQMLFKLRASGKYLDKEIAAKLNEAGYRTRIRYTYSKTNPGKVIKQTGGKEMNIRSLWKIARRTIYAGVNTEKWTDNKPVHCLFDGLVSIETFNAANNGRLMILEEPNRALSLKTAKTPERYANKGKRHKDFPYKKHVHCPECRKPLLGSASRGKMGKYYPAYHCSKRGHNFRVTKDQLEAVVANFVSGIEISQEHTDVVFQAIEKAWERSNAEYALRVQSIDDQITELEGEALLTVDKIKMLSSKTAVTYMEEDLMKIEKKIDTFKARKEAMKSKKPVDFSKVLQRAKYMVEHFNELVVQQMNPIKKAQFFGLIFDQTPTYADLYGGTPQNIRLHPLFELIKKNQKNSDSLLVTPRRIELRFPD